MLEGPLTLCIFCFMAIYCELTTVYHFKAEL